MGRSIYYRLERYDNGTWQPDSREFLPAARGLILSPYISGTDGDLSELARSISLALQSLSKDGFPPEASPALSREADQMFARCSEEFEPLPRFGWLSVEDILRCDWSPMVGNSDGKRCVIAEWMALLRSLGPATKHRIVWFWS